MTGVTRPWPNVDLETLDACPVCGSGARRLLYTGLTDRVFGVADGTWDLYKCEGCSSGYLDPRPTVESIGRAYASYYTHAIADNPVIRRKGLIRRLLHDLVNGYQNRVYGLTKSPASSVGRWLLPLFPPLRSAADAECRHLQSAFTGARLLDVGCGNGGFLTLAKKAGWEVEGVDFDKGAVDAARSRGLNVHLGGLDVLGERRDYYDVITICHVIEHVHNPGHVLSMMYDMLKPGGMLWIDTPNLDSLGASWFGSNWRDLDPPRHLHLFSRRALTMSLRKAGFRSFKQRWRGMSVFEVFAASEAIAKTGGCSGASYQGKPPVKAVIAEFWEMIRPSRREFLTITVRK